MTDMSARFALPLLQPGQAQKELFHNEALGRIDAALHPAVMTAATNAPPAGPAAGQAWFIGGDPSGAWTGRAGQIATWTDGGWRYIVPVAGMLVWLADLRRWAWHDGITLQVGALPVAGLSVDGKRVVGARGGAISGPQGGVSIDVEARAAISSILDALRTHGLIDT